MGKLNYHIRMSRWYTQPTDDSKHQSNVAVILAGPTNVRSKYTWLKATDVIEMRGFFGKFTNSSIHIISSFMHMYQRWGWLMVKKKNSQIFQTRFSSSMVENISY